MTGAAIRQVSKEEQRERGLVLVLFILGLFVDLLLA